MCDLQTTLGPDLGQYARSKDVRSHSHADRAATATYYVTATTDVALPPRSQLAATVDSDNACTFHIPFIACGFLF